MTDQQAHRDQQVHRDYNEQHRKTAEAAKKRLGEMKAEREKTAKEAAEVSAATKPTPTQEENDMAAMGVPMLEHEPDGSPQSDPYAATLEHKQSEAKKPASGYQTRTVKPAET